MADPEVAAGAGEDVQEPEETSEGGPYSSESVCLMLQPDTESGEDSSSDVVKEVVFKRDERGEGSIDDSAAELLGIRGERVRCFVLPGFERKMGMSLHMYIDLQGMEHNMPHNTNATQLYLLAHLPDEPPQVYPSSIHGPVLLSAENFKTEEYINLGLSDWAKIKSICRAVQPNAQFVPYEPPSAEEEERPLDDD